MSTAGSSRTLIELPKLDGYLEAGIAAGVDPTLPEADKLPIHGKTTQEIYNNSVALTALRDFHDERTNTLFITGVAAIVGCGMLRMRNGIPDGVWYESNTATLIPEEARQGLIDKIMRESLTTANTIICATKVKYWLMNHHVGQTADRNTAVGYVQRVLVLKFGSPLPANMVHAVHMLGHYASTRFILSKASIPNILSTEARVGSDAYEIRFADEQN
jgi:hypothetical protein